MNRLQVRQGRKTKPHRHYVGGEKRKERVDKEVMLSLLVIVKIVSKKFQLGREPPPASCQMMGAILGKNNQQAIAKKMLTVVPCDICN
jgi:hypothetical protein